MLALEPGLCYDFLCISGYQKVHILPLVSMKIFSGESAGGKGLHHAYGVFTAAGTSRCESPTRHTAVYHKYKNWRINQT